MRGRCRWGNECLPGMQLTLVAATGDDRTPGAWGGDAAGRQSLEPRRASNPGSARIPCASSHGRNRDGVQRLHCSSPFKFRLCHRDQDWGCLKSDTGAHELGARAVESVVTDWQIRTNGSKKDQRMAELGGRTLGNAPQRACRRGVGRCGQVRHTGCFVTMVWQPLL